MLFVFTDGFQTKRGQFTPPDVAAKPLKKKGVDIWSVGIGEAINKDELTKMASKPSNVIVVKSIEDLKTYVFKIRESICKGKFEIFLYFIHYHLDKLQSNRTR